MTVKISTVYADLAEIDVEFCLARDLVAGDVVVPRHPFSNDSAVITGDAEAVECDVTGMPLIRFPARAGDITGFVYLGPDGGTWRVRRRLTPSPDEVWLRDEHAALMPDVPFDAFVERCARGGMPDHYVAAARGLCTRYGIAPASCVPNVSADLDRPTDYPDVARRFMEMMKKGWR